MKIIVYGYGLMGKKITQSVLKDETLELVGVVSPVFDGEVDFPTYNSLKECEKVADAIIDFSHPNNLDDVLAYSLKNNCKVVIATTGFNEEQIHKIEEASSHIAIFQSYNTSFGIQMLTRIVKEVSKEFYDNGFDIEILEKHHNQKIDAPSGTAKLLYDVIEESVENTTPVYDRTLEKHKREKNEVGILAMRGGTIFGEHVVMYAGNDEIVEIKHTALSKDVFVQGAIAAVKALENKDQGLFTLKTLY